MGGIQSYETDDTNQIEKDSTDYLGPIPNDIVIVILSFLDYQSLIRVSQLSKRLQKISDEPQL